VRNVVPALQLIINWPNAKPSRHSILLVDLIVSHPGAMKDAQPSSASPVHGLQNKDSKENALWNENGESKRAKAVDANNQQGDEDDRDNDFLVPESSWLDPSSSGPAADDITKGKDSHHASLTSMWAHSKQGPSQIISQASGVADPQRRRKGSSRIPEGDGGATAASPVAQALKRVSIELPLELSRVDSSTDGASASGSPASAASIPYRILGGSKSRRIDFSTSAPVSRTVTASMHCQAGLKGTRTGFSNANVEIRYKPTPARRNGTDGSNHTSGIITRRSDATYTAGLALTERPSLSVGATHVVTGARRERSTTWSWKIASPKLNPATMTLSPSSSWWKGMAGRLGWSRDVSTFCTVRSTLALALPQKVDDSHRAPTSSRQNRAGSASPTTAISTLHHQMPGAILHRFVRALSAASVALASRNTLHKWSASLSWSLLNFPSIRRRGGDAAKDDGKQDQEFVPLQTLSWQPRISLSVSPELPKALAARSCRVSGWYSLADSSWSVATSMSKAIRGTHVSLGWTKASSGSWAYLITVSLGSMATIRIPVTVTAVLDPFWYPVQVGFASIVSGLIQEAVSHALVLPSSASNHGTGLGGSSSSSDEESDALASSRRQRARKLAENQQSLMRRTAENRMRAERAKSNEQRQHGGLVIDRAVYYTDRESWDVTVPLQFWVQDSLLDIGPATKKDLLGFYDLSYRAEPAKSLKDEPTKSWISGFWTPRGDKEGSNGDLGGGGGGGGSRHRSATRQLVTPQLKIEYTFNGQPHQAIFQDHDEILLPREAFVN
jgi:Domain of unknown function (DUF3395)